MEKIKSVTPKQVYSCQSSTWQPYLALLPSQPPASKKEGVVLKALRFCLGNLIIKDSFYFIDSASNYCLLFISFPILSTCLESLPWFNPLSPPSPSPSPPSSHTLFP
ncbi:hypothetical protein AYI68_g4852 [Smittium mucronatum]|uniref:Uncharacterized protein n=1 Tax=Smittium mucronatum TaxID=133383 RepID=A0A1R0GVW2_9FUNG|nr:hypothetical protein AYI68_g4852 [Smittium mucronatum]